MSTASPGSVSPFVDRSLTATATNGQASDGSSAVVSSSVPASSATVAATPVKPAPIKATPIKTDPGQVVNLPVSSAPFMTPKNALTEIKPEFTGGETEVRKPVLQSSTVETPISKPTYPLTFANSAFSNQEDTLGEGADGEPPDGDEQHSKVSAYARLDFESFTFYVQTLQVILGRRAENGSGMVDVHLGPARAISRRHAKIFYNFGTQRFELSVLGRNGAFVSDVFVETGSTVPLSDGTKIQIGQIPFTFVLPSVPVGIISHTPQTTMNPSDASTLKEKSRQLSRQGSPMPKRSSVSPDTDFNIGEDALNGKRKPRKEYAPEEIPEQYRTKPPHSYSHLIATALRAKAPPTGMSLSDIYGAIQDLFPFYKYCPPGWQNSVRHNLSSNRAFKKISKEGKGWMWGIDEEYFSEKELQKKKAAAAKRSVQLDSNDFGSTGIKSEKSKSIAELAREIEIQRRSDTTSHYQPNYTPAGGPGTAVKQEVDATGRPSITPSPNSIQAQLAANLQNRQRPASQSPGVSVSRPPVTGGGPVQPSLAAGQNTFRMAPAKAGTPAVLQQTSIPQMRVQPQQSSGQANLQTNVPRQSPVASSSTAASAAPKTGISGAMQASGLNLSQDTIKALSLLQQKLQSQLPAGASPAVVTNALALAIAQAAKNSSGKGSDAIAQLLNGKNPAQLAQLLQTALGSIKKASQPGPARQSASPGAPIQTVPSMQTARPVQPVQPVQPMPSVQPSRPAPYVAPSSSSPGPVIPPMTNPAARPTASSASPKTTTPSPSPNPPKSTLAALIQSITPAPGKPPPTAEDIARLLVEAKKLKNPSPAIQSTIKQLEATAARLAAKKAAEGSNGANGGANGSSSTAVKRASVDASGGPVPKHPRVEGANDVVDLTKQDD